MINIYKKLLNFYGYQNWWPTISNNPFEEIVIGAILTQNTSWNNVEKSLKILINNQLLNFKNILKIEEEKLKQFIRSSGFYNQKAKTIQSIAKLFLEKEEISREDLLNTKGIGKETADSILLYALNKPYFVIDNYTKRFLNRLGCIEENISYEKLQKWMCSQLPEDITLYKEFHALIVIHCKNICKKKPDCNTCIFKKECLYYKNLQKKSVTYL